MKLIVQHLSPPRTGQTIAFPEKPFLTMGAKPDNDCVFAAPEDVQVSGRHLQIRQEGDAVVLIDLDSEHGTYVNGHRVTKTALHPEDRIRLGTSGPEFTLTFATSPVNAALASPAPKQGIGATTMQLVVAQALRSAGAVRTGFFRTTAAIEAVLERKLRITTRRYRIALMIAFAAIAALAAALVVLQIAVPRGEPRTQVVSSQDAGTPVARRTASALYLLVGRTNDSDAFEGFCTAFAVAPHLLATNAHCAADIEHVYAQTLAVAHLSGARHTIAHVYLHPDYDPTSPPSWDVALVRIAEPAPSWLSLHPRPHEGVAVGMPVYVYGFAGSLSDVNRPVATFVRGEVGRITRLDRTPGSPRDAVLVQHSAPISAGTSGSPVCDATGAVVAINAGGYAEASGRPLPGYNFAIRVDALTPLLSAASQERAP